MLKLKLADYSNDVIHTYIVNGQEVREEIDIDWCEGGNWLRYTYQPDGEIWIGTGHVREALPVLLHELVEVAYATQHNLDITKDDGYLQAHTEANKEEMAARRNPAVIEDDVREAFQKLTDILSNAEDKTIWTISEK
jgi:hypothetical protein